MRSLVFLLAVLLAGFHVNASEHYASLDRMLGDVQSSIDPDFTSIMIQHSRLAKQSGEQLTPSTVLLFSDPEINSAILQVDPLAGLDLPYRVLFYTSEQGNETVTATRADFLKKRHQLHDEALLNRFDQKLDDALKKLNRSQIKPLNIDRLTHHYGLVVHQSNHDFETTLKRFKDEVIGNNSDTIWFGEIDYTADAEKLGITLPRMKLLLFGAPAPGAKAMRAFKTLGLDAFCQKVLLIEQDGVVNLYSNDVVEFARLHYNDTHPSHRVINFRLNRAYSSIVD